MADESQTTIRAIDWRALFPFLNLFRAFRVAIHPSKLVLGLAALLAVYLGGRVLDAVWPLNYAAVPGELDGYEEFVDFKNPPITFDQGIEAHRRQNEQEYADRLRTSKIEPDPKKSEDAAKSFDYYGKLKASIITTRNERMVKAEEDRKKKFEDIDKITTTDAAAKTQEKQDVTVRTQADVRAAMADAHRELRKLKKLVPHGVFDEFFDYETRQINGVVSSVLAGNWTRAGAAQAAVRVPGRRAAEEAADTERDVSTIGVVPAVQNFFTVGPAWLLRYHLIYAVLFIAWFLLIWAVFGGAISRIAAVHVARDEKISVRQALKFSMSKVLSFVFAPVIPLLIVLVIGVVLGVAGLLFYIPVIGPILGGALLIVGLIAGVVVTLVLFGTVGGLSLMYPTVAVEGSDSFDAISRSFSYVFAKPWRMLFYTIVSVAYGAVCYLFVKFFIYVTLAVTHFFVTWWLKGQPGLWFPEMWPTPTLASLPYDIDFAGLAMSEKVTAFLISFWVYLLIGLLGAFAISFYFSASTIIYYLMRREVDATELDDVYVEESEDDLADIAPVTGATITGATIPSPTTSLPVIATPHSPAASSDPSVPGEGAFTPPPASEGNPPPT